MLRRALLSLECAEVNQDIGKFWLQSARIARKYVWLNFSDLDLSRDYADFNLWNKLLGFICRIDYSLLQSLWIIISSLPRRIQLN